MWTYSIARGLALFLGAFGAANAFGGIVRRGFDANEWWLSGDSPAWFVGPASLALAAWAVAPRSFGAERSRRRRVMLVAAAALLLLALRDLVRVTVILARGDVDAGFPLPASAVVLAALVVVVAAMVRPIPPRPERRAARWGARAMSAAVGAAAFLGFPLLQMFAFGHTDYRRPADAIVVFGARAYADGRPSLALEDRVSTGVELYREGLAPRLVFSGGPGDGEHHEVEVMRDLALELGVPAERIELDYVGLDTASTVRNTVARFRAESVERVLAVSQWYHLPRIKMTYARAGLDVFTVPAQQTRPLRKRYWFLMREIAAFWVYWARP